MAFKPTVHVYQVVHTKELPFVFVGFDFLHIYTFVEPTNQQIS